MIDYNDLSIRGNRRLAREDYELLERNVRSVNPNLIVEIGSMDGTSSMLFGLIAKEVGAEVYCIEPYPKGHWHQNIKELGLQDTVHLVTGFSPWAGRDHIASKKSIDFLFIDGDHRTRWVLVDYHYWSPYVRDGGLIAFHDYNGMKGVKEWVRRAIDIILEDDPLIEIGRNNTRDRGTIVFQKP